MLAPKDYFAQPDSPAQRQYEALRAFFFEGKKATLVAEQFTYKVNTLRSLCRDFRQKLAAGESADLFFHSKSPGRKSKTSEPDLAEKIIALRKQNYSVPDIQAELAALEQKISLEAIWKILQAAGFYRLPRRTKMERQEIARPKIIVAPESCSLNFPRHEDRFTTEHGAGILCFLPFLAKMGIDQMIEQASYPATTVLSNVQSVLSVLALKLGHIQRFSHDDQWCMDRGLGLFAGLNVLPKNGTLSSYSYRITREMNRRFLLALHRYWQAENLLSDTVNMDFTVLPHWGDASVLEKNWSNTRGRALKSVLAVLAHDPESGLISYGDAEIKHNGASNVVLSFVDFWSENGSSPKCLIFDSKFTTYENLNKLDKAAPRVKFITLRRRGQKVIKNLMRRPTSEWQKVKVLEGKRKHRTLSVHDSLVTLKGYEGNVRQVAITGHGRLKPALLISNELEDSVATLVRAYARRWLVEKAISEQIHFFHLNLLSSSIVIKIDFDLTLTILAHNLYRLMAAKLPGFERQSAKSLFVKFIDNAGRVTIMPDHIEIALKKKRTLSHLLTAMNTEEEIKVPWLNNDSLRFTGATTS